MDEVGKLAAEYLKDINRFINLSDLENNESLIYALAQCLHDRLDLLDITEENKGAILSHIVCNLIEFGKEKLALYNNRVAIMHDLKLNTVH